MTTCHGHSPGCAGLPPMILRSQGGCVTWLTPHSPRLEEEEGVAVDWGGQMVMEAVEEREVTEEGRKDEGAKVI